MASGPATKTAVVNDWQPVQANDWQDATSMPSGEPSPPTVGQNLQKAFDELTETPTFDKSKGLAYNASVPLQAFGSGVLSLATPLMHPEKFAKSMVGPHGLGPIDSLVSNPDETKAMAKDIASHPVESAWKALPTFMLPEVGEAAESGIAKIPSKARAGEAFRTVEQAAANTPVNPVNAWPEIERFRELVKAGGKGSRPVTQLAKRLEGMVRNPQDGSFNFPEARDYYSNISDASHASTLSKVMGTAPKPVMLRQLGAIRKAFDEDLTNTAGKVGHADTYANAMDEYARAARLRKALIAGGGMAAGAAIGGTLPGKVLSKFIPTH